MGSVTMGTSQTLAEIAAKYNMTEAQLVEMNPSLKGVKNVPIGQTINVADENMGLEVEHMSDAEVDARYDASSTSTVDRLEARGRQITDEVEKAIDKQIDDFRRSAREFGEAVYNEMTEDFNTMRETLISAYEQGEQAYNNARNLVQISFRKSLTTAQELAKKGTELAETAVNTSIEFAEDTFNSATELIDRGIDAALETYNIATDKMGECYNTAKAKLKALYNDVKNGTITMEEAIETAVEEGLKKAGEFVDDAGEFISSIPDMAKRGTYVALGALAEGVETAVDTAGKAYDATIEFAEETYDSAKELVNKGIDTALEAYDIATDKLGECYDAAKAKLGELYEDVKNGVMTVDEAIETAIAEGLDKAREFVDDTVEFAKELPGLTQKGLHVVIGGLAEGFETAVDTAGKAYDATIEFAEETYNSAKALVNKGIDSALEAYDIATDKLGECYDAAKAKLGELYEDVKNGVMTVDEAIETAVAEGLEKAREFVNDAGEFISSIPDLAKKGTYVVVGALAEGFETAVDTAGKAYDATIEFAEETYNSAKALVSKGIDSALEAYDIATDKLGECYDAAKAKLGELYEDVKNGVMTVDEAIETAIAKGLEKAREFVDDAVEFTKELPGLTQKGFHVVIGGLAEGVEAVTEATTELVNKGVQTAKKIYHNTTEFIADASAQVKAKLQAAGKFTQEAYNKALAQLKALGNQVLDRAISFEAAVESAITKGIQDVKEGTVKVVQSGKKVIRKAVSKADKKVTGAAHTAKKYVQSGFRAIRADVRPSNAPSRTSTVKHKKNESRSSYYARKGEALVDDAKDAAKRAWNSGVDAAESGARNVYRGASKAYNTAKDAGKKFMNWLGF